MVEGSFRGAEAHNLAYVEISADQNVTESFCVSDSSDAIRRISELGIQCGYQRRNKEILSWARKKRRHIRREDLLAYLAGKSPPPRPHHHR